MNFAAELDWTDISRLLAVSRAGDPFVYWRQQAGLLEILQLGEREVVTIGRRSSCDLSLPEDSLASRTHAKLERIGDDWVLFDDGISRNGTFVNGRRTSGYRRMADGDSIRVGATVIEFRDPRTSESALTNPSQLELQALTLTATQSQILTALCRPLVEHGSAAAPASNREIADEVFLGIDAVKAHLGGLYKRFDINLPQNKKRARLAEQALQLGLVQGRPLPR